MALPCLFLPEKIINQPMLTLTGATEISRRSAQHRQITVSRRNTVSIRPRNAIRVAYHALFPWTVSMNVRDREAYPGAFNGLCALVGKRASIPAIKFWINGHRNPPAWFVNLLRDRLLQRREEIDQAIAELDALPPRLDARPAGGAAGRVRLRAGRGLSGAFCPRAPSRSRAPASAD